MASSIIHESESFSSPLRGGGSDCPQQPKAAEENKRIHSLLQRDVKYLQTLGRAKQVVDRSVCLSSGPLQIAASFSWPKVQGRCYIEYLYTKEAILPLW